MAFSSLITAASSYTEQMRTRQPAAFLFRTTIVRLRARARVCVYVYARRGFSSVYCNDGT